MKKIITAALALVVFGVAGADVGYPLDIDEWEGRTAYYDTATATITDRSRSWPATDPDTYTCPLCGVLPVGWPANVVPLLEVPAGPTPTYDSRLTILRAVEVICGPDAGSLDPRCKGDTDRLKAVWETVDRPVSERIVAAQNEAAFRTLAQLPEDKFRLHVLVQLGLNMMRLNSSSLPPKWQAVNDAHWTFLQNKILPIWNRRKELIDAANGVGGAVINGGDMDQGWPIVDPADLPE